MPIDILTEPATPKLDEKSSLTDRLFLELLERIRSQEWVVGATFPSERALTEEYSVSRNVMRETISRLRALGVLSVKHGKRSIVAKMDSNSLGRLFPLMLSLEGKQSFQDIHPVRYALELAAVQLACINRTPEDITAMQALLTEMQNNVNAEVSEYAKIDLELHLQIARASHNPLFEPLLQTLSAFVIDLQRLGITADPNDRDIVEQEHKAIVDAIRDQDAPRGQKEMSNHLVRGSDKINSSGVLTNNDTEVELKVDPTADAIES